MSLSADVTDANFVAVLIGDVTGTDARACSREGAGW